ncbi:MAG: hypothetical protein NVSMB2_20460 [Chloroflexota bacterium]
MVRSLSSRQHCFQTRWLQLAVAGGVTLVVSTELLSSVAMLTRGPLLVVWSAFSLLAVILLWSDVQQTGYRGPRLHVPAIPLIVGIAGVCVMTALSAWFAPPNNIDSLNYHLSRVANWEQHASVADYPTSYLPQLYQPPLAEFAILHLNVLVGSDQLANAVQWFSMIGTLLTVVVLAARLGLAWQPQLLSAAFVAALPIGILEASSTQNDYVASFWLICFVACILDLRHADALTSREPWLRAGGALGLALLAKGTNYVYALPFIAALGVWVIGHLSRERLVAMFALAIVALGLNAGHYSRNFDLFSNPLGPLRDESADSAYTVDRLTAASFASNLVRNLALHLGTNDRLMNRDIFNTVEAIHRSLGLPIDLPATTWTGTRPGPVRLDMHESRSGNLFALVTIAGVLVVGVLNGTFTRRSGTTTYGAAWLAGIILFCAIFKWQPWNARLHLQWFILAAPVVGQVCTRRLKTPLALGVSAALIALLLWLYWTSGGVSGPRLALAATGVVILLGLRRGLSRVPRLSPLLHGITASLRRAASAATSHAWVLVGVAFLIGGVPWAVGNVTRPLVGNRNVFVAARDDQYFVNAEDLEQPVLDATTAVQIATCDRIGISATPGDLDYPIWVFVKATQPSALIRNVNVQNVSQKIRRFDVPVCAVIAFALGDDRVVTVDGAAFQRLPLRAQDASPPPLAPFIAVP